MDSLKHFLVACLSITVLGGCGLSGDLSITPKQLRVVATDDNSVIGTSKDEPYIGYIKFKATFGNPSSVVVRSNTDLTTIDTSAEAGDVFDLSGLVDPINFNSIEVMSRSDLNNLNDTENPRGPTIAGAIFFGVDHDNPGKGNVRDAIDGGADILREALVTHVGGGEWGFAGAGMLVALAGVASEFDTGGGGGPIWLQKLIGDDLVGTAMLLYIGMTPAQFADMEPGWEFLAEGQGAEWVGCPTGPSAIAICPIQPEDRTLILNESRSDGDYRLMIETDFTAAD